MNNSNPATNTEAREVLLIGDLSAVVSGAFSPEKLPIQVCNGFAEAVETALEKSFTAILVVMSDVSAGLRNRLAVLRKNTGAKILLLARMHEEPLAIELVARGNGNGLADDYVICPLRIEQLCEAVHRRTAFFEGTSAVAADETTRKKIRQLEKLATEDDLTGLKNRRYVREFARQIIERSKKDNGRVTVLIFDIDNFKHYNDVYGHAAGDEVLKQAAMLIRRCCRRHDVVARLGGDEFAVVFWDEPLCPPPPDGSERRSFTSDHPGEVIMIARRFRRELEKTPLQLPGANGTGVLTISGGLASLGRNGSNTDDIFAKADHALLDAKRSGKNRIYLVGQPENDIDKIQ